MTDTATSDFNNFLIMFVTSMKVSGKVPGVRKNANNSALAHLVDFRNLGKLACPDFVAFGMPQKDHDLISNGRHMNDIIIIMNQSQSIGISARGRALGFGRALGLWGSGGKRRPRPGPEAQGPRARPKPKPPPRALMPMLWL